MAPYEQLNEAEGRQAAYRLRHKKANGKTCVAYVGPEALALWPPQPRTVRPCEVAYIAEVGR